MCARFGDGVEQEDWIYGTAPGQVFFVTLAATKWFP